MVIVEVYDRIIGASLWCVCIIIQVSTFEL